MSGQTGLEFVQNFPCFSIMFCMFAGIVSSAFKEKIARILNVVVLTVNIILSAAVFLFTVRTGEAYVYVMGRFPAPWGNELRIGVLEAGLALFFCVIMLMVEDAELKKQEMVNDRRFEPKNDAILQGTAMILVPIIFIFGIYIILNGHLSPGGGFSGGATIGAGMILYASAFGFKKTQRFFDEKIYKVAKVSALCVYGLVGIYYYVTGANGIENHIPLGIPGHIVSAGIIFPINICVGIEVACTMYAFYALFRRGGL